MPKGGAALLTFAGSGAPGGAVSWKRRHNISTSALGLLPEGGTRWCTMLTLFLSLRIWAKREQFSGLVARFRAVAPEPGGVRFPIRRRPRGW